MQSTFTNICERLGQEFSELKLGVVIGCHHCNMSVCEQQTFISAQTQHMFLCADTRCEQNQLFQIAV